MFARIVMLLVAPHAKVAALISVSGVKIALHSLFLGTVCAPILWFGQYHTKFVSFPSNKPQSLEWKNNTLRQVTTK